MSIYLGTLGRMIQVKCPQSQQLNFEGEPVFRTTIGGRRVAHVPIFSGKRTWSNQLSDASTPPQIADVMSFINHEWGNGPFWFVSADAPVTNLLPPDAASIDPKLYLGAAGTEGGPMLTPHGWAPRSVRNTNSTELVWFGRELVPTPPTGEITGAAYVLGSQAKAQIYFFNASGSGVGVASAAASNDGAHVTRSVVTATPPKGAVSCRIVVADALQACRPSLTWTEEVLEWGEGQGCPKAIVHNPSRELVMATRSPGSGRYSNLSFTVTEVG